jgi:hypothetical protein
MDGENVIKMCLQIQDWKVWAEFICFKLETRFWRLRMCYIKRANFFDLLKIIMFHKNVKLVNSIKMHSNWSYCIFRIGKYLSATLAIKLVWKNSMLYRHYLSTSLQRFPVNTKKNFKKFIINNNNNNNNNNSIFNCKWAVTRWQWL